MYSSYNMCNVFPMHIAPLSQIRKLRLGARLSHLAEVLQLISVRVKI